jgi:N-acyl-L-homoserine lactone synthetase
MFHVINKGNRNTYADFYRRLCEHRYNVFVKEDGSSKFYPPNPLKVEVDKFDTLNSTWMTVVDPNYNFLAGGRMTSWIYPTMAGERYTKYNTKGELPWGRDDYVDFTRAFLNCPTVTIL